MHCTISSGPTPGLGPDTLRPAGADTLPPLAPGRVYKMEAKSAGGYRPTTDFQVARKSKAPRNGVFTADQATVSSKASLHNGLLIWQVPCWIGYNKPDQVPFSRHSPVVISRAC